MQNEILAYLNDPRQLEKMYRTNKTHFKQAFAQLYPQLKGNILADFWNERLNYEAEDINWGTRRELFFVLIGALIAGTIAKLPALLSLNEELFYTRNVGFIIFPILSAYFAWKNNLSAIKITLMAAATLAGLIFINVLPGIQNDTVILSCVHLLIFLWSILGFAFVGTIKNDDEKRLSFLKYNGDLAVMTALVVIAAGIMSGITLGLFKLIGLDIQEFYFENIVIFGLPAAPILGTYLVQTNPQLVGKVSPVIAKIFSPLVLVMLVIYLSAMMYLGKDPFTDRDFLMIFNALLIGVMAIIFFSVAGTPGATKSKAEVWVLFLLSLVTIVVNGIALSAILFRISEWGLSPNRAAILGGNVLILVNLLLVTTQFFRVLTRRANINAVGKTIASYLPVYCIWATIVCFLFPLLFGFK